MKKFLGLIILFMVINTGNIFAKVIIMDEFVKAYLEKSVPLRSDYLDLKKSIVTLNKLEGLDDIKLGISANYDYRNGGVDGFNTVVAGNTYNYGVQLDKTFTDTGTTLSLAHTLNYMDNTYIPTVLNIPTLPSIPLGYSNLVRYSPIVSLSVIQPVLKNWLGLQSKLPKKLAYLDEKVKEITYFESLETKIIEGIGIYLDWLYLYNQKGVLKKIIDENLTLLKEIEQRYKAGISQLSDLESTRSNVINFQNSLIDVDNAYTTTLDRMRKFLAIESDDIPEEQIINQSLKLNIPAEIRYRLLENLDYLKKQLELNIGAKKNNLMPDLNLLATYKLFGIEDNTGGAWNSGLNRSEIFVGFTFSLPLWNYTAKGELDEFKIEYEKLIDKISDTAIDLKIGEKNLKDAFMTREKIIIGHRAYIKSLDTKYRDEYRQYRQGILDFSEIIRTSLDLSNAKLLLTNYLIMYHKSYYQYLGFIDQMLDVYAKIIPETCKPDYMKKK